MDIEIVPCSVEHLEKLIEGANAFLEAYKLQAVDGYMPVFVLTHWQNIMLRLEY